MCVIATLLVRDEEEIVQECIEHHVRHGVDKFIVTDNGSNDRTREIVAASKNVIEIIDEPAHNHHQSAWVTRMARHAVKHNPDWIVHIDADEFWLGLEILQDGKRFSGVGVITVQNEAHHVAVAGLSFGTFTRAQMPYYRKVGRPMPKVIHRPSVKPNISHGNHFVTGVAGRHINAPRSICIHHYPVRSYDHFEAKTIKGGTALMKHKGPWSNGKRWRGWYKHYKDGTLEELYNQKHLYTNEMIERGLKDGTLQTYVPED